MNDVKKHFEAEAEEFDQIILSLIPYYKEMVNALVSAIPFEQTKPINVIDLGCGTATIAKQVKEKFPNAKITCVDLAENMIEVAKNKLREYTEISYQVEDFYNFAFGKKYDVAISSLALHHLATNQDKQRFYEKIFNALSPGGVFYNADVVLGSSEFIQEVYMAKWQEFMLKNVPLEEIRNKWLPTAKKEDKPAQLIKQLNWLVDIGFDNVDVIWKYYNFAVYGGST